MLWRKFRRSSAAIVLITRLCGGGGPTRRGLAWLKISGEDAADWWRRAVCPPRASPRQDRSGADRDHVMFAPLVMALIFASPCRRVTDQASLSRRSPRDPALVSGAGPPQQFRRARHRRVATFAERFPRSDGRDAALALSIPSSADHRLITAAILAATWRSAAAG